MGATANRNDSGPSGPSGPNERSTRSGAHNEPSVQQLVDLIGRINDRLYAAEQRVADCERVTRLVSQSSLESELRLLEANEKRRLAREIAKRREAEKRRRATPQRVLAFKRFAAQRLAVHADLTAEARKLFAAFVTWCKAERVDWLAQCESLPELREVVMQALPDVAHASVPADGSPSPRTTTPGYVGIGLVPDGQTPAEFLAALQAMHAQDTRDAEQQMRRHARESEVEQAILRRRMMRDRAAEVAVQAAEATVQAAESNTSA